MLRFCAPSFGARTKKVAVARACPAQGTVAAFLYLTSVCVACSCVALFGVMCDVLMGCDVMGCDVMVMGCDVMCAA